MDVRLDTGVLLESMIEQARLAVFKAVARATSVTPPPDRPAVSASASPAALSGFSASINTSSGDLSAGSGSSGDSHPSTQVLKARSSALRLSNVLSGKSGEAADSQMSSSPLNKTRKNRSVRWDHPMQTPSRDASNFPSAKRQRMVQSQARLRSTKSFGRPHADHGSGPRNATFGDFGSAQHTWGKDGKLKNHPRPGGQLSRLSAFHTNNSPTEDKNAPFDLQRRTTVNRENTLSLLGMVGAAQQQQPQSGGPAMPRTATALENWLVNATKGGAAAGLM